jgi:hypothetical protein
MHNIALSQGRPTPNPFSLRSLIRLIRNLYHHFPTRGEVTDLLVSVPTGLANRFFSRFPRFNLRYTYFILICWCRLLSFIYNCLGGFCILSTAQERNLLKTGKLSELLNAVEAAMKRKESKLQDAAMAAVLAPGITWHGFLVDTAIVCRVEQWVVRQARQSELRHTLRGYLVLSGLKQVELFLRCLRLRGMYTRSHQRSKSIQASLLSLPARQPSLLGRCVCFAFYFILFVNLVYYYFC